MWIKESLTLSPAELAGIGVWLTLAVDREDGVRRAGRHASRSSARSGGPISSSARLAPRPGCSLSPAPPAAGSPSCPHDQLYLFGALLIVLGTVIQDVVADAMSTRWSHGSTRTASRGRIPKCEAELGMVQVMGRLALSAGILAVAGRRAGSRSSSRGRRCSCWRW